jgi:glycosyltransferase involved in cell wall biosynthesis
LISVSSIVFNTNTPSNKPLEEAESGACYLTEQLAARGHSVTLISNTADTGLFRGVQCEGINCLNAEYFSSNNFDAIILQNSAENILYMRSILPAQTPLILWTGHDSDQPALGHLLKPEIREALDYVVGVSNWHRGRLRQNFQLDPESCVVMKNAISPSFENMFSSLEELKQSKTTDSPSLFYTSTPFRGLSLLLPLFSNLQQQIPEVKLEIFSSMAVYQQAETSEFQALYDQCKATKNCQYHGAIPQPQLAEKMKSLSILCYPNIFPETSCIAVMEAMAAGSFILTSDLGALSETLGGWGYLESVGFCTVKEYAPSFFKAMIETVNRVLKGEDSLWQWLWEQTKDINENYTWKKRAEEWETWIQTGLKRKGLPKL